MNFANLVRVRTARARDKFQRVKGRIGASGRGAMYGSLFNHMRWRVSKLRGRFPR